MSKRELSAEEEWLEVYIFKKKFRFECMVTQDIRWEQRFSNYKKALIKLKDVISDLDITENEQDLINQLSDLEQEGLIQRFEYTHELAWNVMKDFAKNQGNSSIAGSKDATREALKIGIIQNGDVWMQMIASRNLTSHSYDESTAKNIFLDIIRLYYPEFLAFEERMNEKQSTSQMD